MTQQELAALKALAEAATPGPWEEVAESGEWWITSASDETASLYVIPDTGLMNQADVDFIAASRTAVPALLAEVERLRVENERFHAAAMEKTKECARLLIELAHANETIANWEADPEGMQNY